MDLVTRFLAARRDKLLMKLGCWLVCFSLVLGLMLPQQKAEALVAELTIGSVAALAASYLCACGLPLVTQGMDRDALVNSVQRLIQEFLDTELGGITIQDWLGNVWDLAVIAGKLIMGRPLTDEFVSFAQWVAGKYGAQAGENVVYSNRSITLMDGTEYMVSIVLDDWNVSSAVTFTTYSYALGTEILGIPDVSSNDFLDFAEFVFAPGYSIQFRKNLNGTFGQHPEYRYQIRVSQDGVLSDFVSLSVSNLYFLTFVISPVGSVTVAGLVGDKLYVFGYPNKFTIPASVVSPFTSALSIDRAESMSYIPEGIEAEQGVALDVGAAATMDLDLVLQGVLEDVLAGELTSTMEAAGEAVENPPVEDEIADVDNLGLPALGAALTSRFPFSIPWDFFRAVSLLAAPAKAPYFEVDFMEPLADDVGGWNGSTTVILDFSEYAIIGQISRWTSTIGFCLMLAGATKRLIWTA